MSQSLFISDLHLADERPATVALFLRFAAGRARDAERLYILGDLFDAWVGDDDSDGCHGEVIGALRDLTAAGTAVFIQHGNRDFMLGGAFANSTGAQIIDDPHRVQLGSVDTLLMHGDLLCTDDVQYQAVRRMVRDPAWQAPLLARPLAERRALAAEYRKKSGETTSLLPADIMDVNADTVIETMRAQSVSRLIHGHTHRPGDFPVALGTTEAERIVLADWHEDGGEVLVADDNGLHREAVTH
ncbi:MAG: UDP-2,3-diacylglucosamine diphosphatase [Chromatiales bacterium]|nr:UDP-2,3-diacylglucosamine diphosphatase [Chromatiales bacterium]